MSCSADSLAMARTDVESLGRLPRSRYILSEEASDLASLLSTNMAAEVPTLPGLPPPRWSRSSYDRGLEEIHDILDLLWAFREPLALPGGSPFPALAPAGKHFLLNVDGTEVPEEIVKAAVLSAMSPFREAVTLHAVALRPQALLKDPLRGFCRLVQSGRSGLEWQLMEHESPEAFLGWLRSQASDSAPCQVGPPMLFGSLRGHESELRRLCAASGGVAWGRLFAAEPLEALRRWTRSARLAPELVGAPPWMRTDLTHPAVEVIHPLRLEPE
ncbi:unnamed protein product [Polarella glacialis]|uniref:Uncharacterized protein n=1 Tax=Polarella glacialis TaxID=89957 RepID=A0A813D9A1_POLGL|nr:unnamed protein product [Polarella glacialis]